MRAVVGRILLLAAATACGEARPSGSAARETAAADSARPRVAPARYDDTLSIAARADSIDRYVAAHPERMVLFASVAGEKGIVPVKDSTSWPDETEVSYNAVSDSAGRPLLHTQMPTSESGDWFAVERHYFAPDGRTILQVYEISGFGSGCGEVLRENRRTFLAPAGTVIAETRRFTDGSGSPVVADSCYRRSENAPVPKRSAAELPFPAKP